MVTFEVKYEGEWQAAEPMDSNNSWWSIGGRARHRSELEGIRIAK